MVTLVFPAICNRCNHDNNPIGKKAINLKTYYEGHKKMRIWKSERDRKRFIVDIIIAATIIIVVTLAIIIF
ncbi:MAG TPA: hypothetical protein VKA91_06090 [Nitrososphaeraceae archaeon]|nr:hypothetical protein [Nitrososphaeraceae archaeon]